MKGSPILATALACLIMLGMYLGMRMAFSQGSSSPDNVIVSEPSALGDVTVYGEIYFSHEPKSFSITHPASEKVILDVSDPGASDWSCELKIPVEKLTSSEIEFLVKVEWKSPEDGYHFMQLILSPDDSEAQECTLRAEGEIADIMKFDWKEELK